MPSKRDKKGPFKLCGLCGKIIPTRQFRRHREKVHGIVVRYPKLWRAKRDNGRMKTVGPGKRAKSTDWKKIK